VGWLAVLLFKKYEAVLTAKPARLGGVLALSLIVLFSYAYGAHQRNKVWSSSETLWLDAATKGPENGRALMNYGLSLMQKGEYQEAAKYFDKAEQKLPYWAYIHINQGILKNSMGFPEEAEAHFKKAIRYQGFNPEAYYHYARFLQGQKRTDEAIVQIKKALEKSPGHAKSKEYLSYLEAASGKELSLDDLLNREPSVSNFLNLSLAFYRTREYEKSVEMAQKALELNPNSAEAYNNICAANCGLKKWDEAVTACGKALAINPDFQRAKNNLNWALGELNKKE
jgi:tetratricopeptide (TPR) repeat protein